MATNPLLGLWDKAQEETEKGFAGIIAAKANEQITRINQKANRTREVVRAATVAPVTDVQQANPAATDQTGMPTWAKIALALAAVGVAVFAVKRMG